MMNDNESYVATSSKDFAFSLQQLGVCLQKRLSKDREVITWKNS